MRSILLLALWALASTPVAAQVHYHPDGRPWKQRAGRGPDAEVPGWYYNLGPTGLRVELVDDAPEVLVVRYVFEDSPAERRVQVGDRIVGAGGTRFETPHANGYGMDVFGGEGPILDFARALELAQSKEGRGRLELLLERDGKEREQTLKLGTRHGSYGESYPADCERSERIFEQLCDYLLEHQQDSGSFGNPVQNTYAPLALLSSGKRDHRRAAERCARFHARTTKAEDSSSLINWRYMAAGIVLSEYHLATGERWVLEELEEIYTFLIGSQYMDLSQVSPKVRTSHPGSYPKTAAKQRGGWGHNPGFEGYGPISMLTGEGALAFSLMARCGIDVDADRHAAAFAFLRRASGANGYVWYEDEAAGDRRWADMGRTGAAGIANWLAPVAGGDHRTRALAHAAVIGTHPESFPDTHGSPILGMGWAAVAAQVHPPSFRRLMDANRWWFLLSECVDGSFYYQPNRDNAGYGADSRLSASAVTAFIFSLPRRRLAMSSSEGPAGPASTPRGR